MALLIEDINDLLGSSILNVVVDGQRHTFDGVFQVWLRNGGIIDEDCGAARGLLQRVL